MRTAAQLRKSGVALLASRLCVVGHDPCGGSEVVLWEDARILQAAGIPVRVYACAARAGAPVKVIPFRTRTAQLNTIEYARALLRNEPEALILAYNEPALAGCAPDRTIVRFDWTTPLPRYWNWRLWLSRFERARYLFPSESERQIFLQQHARIPSQQAIVIPNAVDLDLFQPAKQASPRRSGGPLRVGFAGQWIARKGVGELLEAWNVVRSALPGCELYIAGGISLWKTVSDVTGANECAACVREMEQQGLVHSVGALTRSAMPGFWNSVDVAVVPSLYEPFGLVALEALACGVPVVATATGGLKEIVVDGECGLLVPPGDIDALARALCSLLTDESLRLRLSAGARLRAPCFSLRRRSHELLEFLSERNDSACIGMAAAGLQHTDNLAEQSHPRR
jgi:glycosyltransferase involved in cell wall biosynthesis